MIIGFFPCLGSLNWIVVPFAGVGTIVSGIALAGADEDSKGSSIAGLVMNVLALVLGTVRLFMGGGVL